MKAIYWTLPETLLSLDLSRSTGSVLTRPFVILLHFYVQAEIMQCEVEKTKDELDRAKQEAEHALKEVEQQQQSSEQKVMSVDMQMEHNEKDRNEENRETEQKKNKDLNRQLEVLLMFDFKF